MKRDSTELDSGAVGRGCFFKEGENGARLDRQPFARTGSHQPNCFVLRVKERVEERKKVAGHARQIESGLKAKSRLDPFFRLLC